MGDFADEDWDFAIEQQALDDAVMGPFAKKHRCRILVICHCLLIEPGERRFFQCCGWYHTRCEGRIND